MRTVRDIADQYGVSTSFVVQALGKIGFRAGTPDTPVSEATVFRFERAYGERIRKARPAEATTEPTTASVPAHRREPRPHVIRVAYERISGRRDMRSMVRYKVLADDPGLAHAIDPEGTREGDPWRGGEGEPGEHAFYEHQGPHAACGVQVKVVMGEVFADERPDACPTCAELVAAGKAFRLGPYERESPWCDAWLRFEDDGVVTVVECRERDRHRGPHRTSEGATWETGEEDYIPAPDG